MNRSHPWLGASTLAVVALVVVSVSRFASAQQPATQPSLPPGHPPVGGPATRPAAQISPEAQVLVDQLARAYGGVQSLEVAGRMEARFDVGGQKQEETVEFTGAYLAPNRFRHEVKDELTLGSTGGQLYLYNPRDNTYAMNDLAEGQGLASSLPYPMPQILQSQNPALLLALIPDPAGQLTSDVDQVNRIDDVEIGQRRYPAIKLTQTSGAELILAVDPQTYLPRRVTFDSRRVFEQRGMPDVKSASVVIDYITIKPGARLEAERFAFAPPAGARDVGREAQPAGQAQGDAAAEHPLAGKAAPEFALKDLGGQTISLAEQKGSVVVLDFWATWCPPCRASLPKLQELHEQTKDRGVRVYAVDIQEDRQKVQQFLKNNNLSLPVLLDADGQVAQAYGASSIPQTVVIGKDGKVLKVLTGFVPGQTEEQLRQAVEQALGQ